VESLPPVYSIRAWTADGYPAQIAFNEEMRATGVDVIDRTTDSLSECRAMFGINDVN
jgi:hypothetical protein